MAMLDRLHGALTPRPTGVLNLVFVSWGVFAPPLAAVISDTLTSTLTPLASLLLLLALTHAVERGWPRIAIKSTRTALDMASIGTHLCEGIKIATVLCFWMTLGACGLYWMTPQ